MKLVQPTDFDVLSVLADGRRNTAANIACHIDKNRAYINTRLPILADYGLIQRVGPAPNSGLYEITARGEAAVDHREVYDEVDDFGAVIDDAMKA